PPRERSVTQPSNGSASGALRLTRIFVCATGVRGEDRKSSTLEEKPEGGVKSDEPVERFSLMGAPNTMRPRNRPNPMELTPKRRRATVPWESKSTARRTAGIGQVPRKETGRASAASPRPTAAPTILARRSGDGKRRVFPAAGAILA